MGQNLNIQKILNSPETVELHQLCPCINASFVEILIILERLTSVGFQLINFPQIYAQTPIWKLTVLISITIKIRVES